jgi:hypothetical protein
MNKKLVLSVFFILAIFMSATYTNAVSADTTAPEPSTTIVISQVYGGGGGTGTYLFDYVELFNISNSPQSLNGLSLVYGSATGQFGSVATNIVALPNVTLQPGQHFLVQLGAAGTAGANLPVTPDFVSTNITASNSSGKIAFVTRAFTPNTCGATATPCNLPNAAIIDVVSYGAANNGEGNTTAGNGTALTSTQGAVRAGNGCTDTDNNNNDFAVATAPVPRNLAAPATPCGGAQRGTLFDFTGSGRTSFVTLALPVDGLITWKIAANPALPGPNNAFIRKFDFGRVGDGQTFGDAIVANDYIGDLKTEVAVYRDTDSTYYLAQTPTGTGGVTLARAQPWGNGATDTPGGEGDYDGDGKADFTSVRVSGGSITWYILSSSTNAMKAINFGTITGVTGPSVFPGADFTGDGRDELVYVFRNAAGTAVTYNIGDANTGAGIITRTFGNFLTDYSVAPDDYTGDGRADFVAVRATGAGPNLIWYVNNSVTNAITATTFGVGGFSATASDVPVRGDYDGDGRHDIAVWRPSNQTFYWINSTNGSLQSQQFGDAGDTPLGSFGLY